MCVAIREHHWELKRGTDIVRLSLHRQLLAAVCALAAKRARARWTTAQSQYAVKVEFAVSR